MADFTKLASYLDSFGKDQQGYDIACYLKAKIAQDLQDKHTINNGSEEHLEDNDITMSTPEQQSSDNYEGKEMDGAFQEFDVLNKLKEEKEEIHMPGKKDNEGRTNLDVSTEEAFGDNVQNQKHASLLDYLKSKLRK
jgi:hypothetical protein